MCSPGSSGSRFATISIGRDGAQLPLLSTRPTGRLCTPPQLSSDWMSTRRVDRIVPPVRLANRRTVGCWTPTQNVGLVASPPAGIRSAVLSPAAPTLYGSLPATGSLVVQGPALGAGLEAAVGGLRVVREIQPRPERLGRGLRLAVRRRLHE